MYLKSRAKPYKLSMYSTMLFLQPFLQWIKDASQFNTAHYVPNTEIFVLMKINFYQRMDCLHGLLRVPYMHFVIFRLSGYDCIKYFVEVILLTTMITQFAIYMYIWWISWDHLAWACHCERKCYNKTVYFIAQCYNIEHKIQEIVKLCQQRDYHQIYNAYSSFEIE